MRHKILGKVLISHTLLQTVEELVTKMWGGGGQKVTPGLDRVKDLFHAFFQVPSVFK